MNNHQDIVPVRLQDENRSTPTHYRKQNPQKLVARLKCKSSELFIYEGITEDTLCTLLSELNLK